MGGGLQIMMADDGGRGNLAVDDVTFYHHFLELNFWFLAVLVLSFDNIETEFQNYNS